MKLSALLPPLLVVMSILAAVHAFVGYTLVAQCALPAPWARLGYVPLAVGFLALPVTMVTSRLLVPEGLAALPLRLGYIWFGVIFYLFLGSLLLCLLAAGSRLVPAALWQSAGLAAYGPLFWRRLGAFFVLALAAGATGTALWGVRAGPRVVRVEVPLAKLPVALDGLTIAQISDLHVAALLRRPYVEKVVARTLALHPDVIVLTGDLVDGSVPQLEHDIAPLAELRAPLGTYVITGNHEYYSGPDAWLAHFVQLGLTPLRNARVSLEKNGARLDLAGIDDATAHHYGHGHGADLPRALAGRDGARPLVLLAHQPKVAAEAQAAGVDLLLSGHTHGGQMWPFGYAVRLAQPFVQGLSLWQGLYIYVNPGTGYWGPPMRLGAPAEITLLTLRAPKAPPT